MMRLKYERNRLNKIEGNSARKELGRMSNSANWVSARKESKKKDLLKCQHS
jgi:hypothetical protein